MSEIIKPSLARYSHSIVAGGLFVISYTTLVTPSTSFVILLETLSSKLHGGFEKFAVIPSTLSTTRIATVAP